MKTDKHDKFKSIIENSTEVAKQLQLVFPDARDALMCLALILTGLSKSADVPLSKLVELITAIYLDLGDFEDEIHNLH